MDKFSTFDEIHKKIIASCKIEMEHKYIDVLGKKTNFSKFILSTLYTVLKKINKTERHRVEKLISHFEQYRIDSPSARAHSVELLAETFAYFKKLIKPQIRIKKKEDTPETKKPYTDDISEIDVQFVKGVGPKTAPLFNKLGIFTVKDLLEYYPKRYVDYQGRVKIANLKIGEQVTVFATIKKVNAYLTLKRLTVLNLTIGDGTGEITLSFFYKLKNRRMLERYKAQYPQGSSVIVFGTVKRDTYTNKITIDKPEVQVMTCDFCYEDDELINLGKIVPIYPLTENLNSKTLSNAIKSAIEKHCSKIQDPMPQYIKEKYNLIEKNEAIVKIHLPKTREDADKARFRIVFDELFTLQLNLALMREANKKNTSIQLKIKRDGLVRKFIENLPFELTDAQKKAVEEITNDLNSKEPMQRLLQGDVGSGKTVVACIMLLCAIENGYQGAIMAPTEILATQHYKNFIQWLTPLNLSVGLFLGKHGVKIRNEMLTSLKNGQMHIAVGTHALIQEGVEFNNLGAVVIDEQHRFGVKQRSKLLTKGEFPQMLTMTATPIPRTLALTMHGDLDITTIDELPKGRLPIITTLVSAQGRKDAYNLIKEQIAIGHQAYIVYPLIDESETISAKNATQEAQKLQLGEFKDYKIGLLHGKLKAEEKEQVMLDFKEKKYDILVSTTVVEVGVDVPNATVMIIENAERFGLSQLHQLRGRVGRNDKQSYCVLVSTSASKQVRNRLKIMTQTNNGFIIAQKDLELRGPGEFLGTRQSGIPDFGLADIVNDIEILEKARECALDFVKNYNIEDFKGLREEVLKHNLFRG